MSACAAVQPFSQIENTTRSVRRSLTRVQHARKVVRGELRDDVKNNIVRELLSVAESLDRYVDVVDKHPPYDTAELGDLEKIREMLASSIKVLAFTLDLSTEAGFYDSDDVRPILDRMQVGKDRLIRARTEVEFNISLGEGYLHNAEFLIGSDAEWRHV